MIINIIEQIVAEGRRTFICSFTHVTERSKWGEQEHGIFMCTRTSLRLVRTLFVYALHGERMPFSTG